MYFILSQVPSVGAFSFAMGDCASEISVGKSELLNVIFATQFATGHSSFLTNGSVSIDTGRAFFPDRGMTVADAHGIFRHEFYHIFRIFSHLLIHVTAGDLRNKDSQLLKDWQYLLQTVKNAKQTGKSVFLLIRDAEHHTQHIMCDDPSKLRKMFPMLDDFYSSADDVLDLHVMALPNLSDGKIASHFRTFIRDSQIKPAVLKSMHQLLQKMQHSESALVRDDLPTKYNFLQLVGQDSGLNEVHTAVEEVLSVLEIHKQDFFDPDLVPARATLAELRACEKRKCHSEEDIDKKTEEETHIKARLKELRPSLLIDKFIGLLHLPEHLAFPAHCELATRLKIFSSQNIASEMRDLEELRKKCKSSKQNVDSRPQTRRQIEKLDKIIDRKTISVEVIWRELVAVCEHTGTWHMDAEVFTI